MAYYPDEKEPGNSEVKPDRDNQATMQNRDSLNWLSLFFLFPIINKIELYFSEVGSELHCKGAVEYMKTNGCRHRPSYLYIGSLPKNEAIMVLNDVGIDTSEYSYVGRGEILAKIPTIGQTTYQEIAKIAINGWLNSIGHRGTIINVGMFGGLEILGISSSYNEKTRSVDIALTLFTALK